MSVAALWLAFQKFKGQNVILLDLKFVKPEPLVEKNWFKFKPVCRFCVETDSWGTDRQGKTRKNELFRVFALLCAHRRGPHTGRGCGRTEGRVTLLDLKLSTERVQSKRSEQREQLSAACFQL